jgi:transglutaminase-like putative cysteine protease
MAWRTAVFKPRGTDGSLLVSLPWTLAAVAVSLAPHLVFLPPWITAAFLICSAWRYLIERRRRPLPSVWFRAGLALLCFLGVLATYQSISGVGPGSALLAIMASLKLLETRQRRDQFVLLFISIFLVMASLLREQYLWSLPYLVVAMLLIVTAWLRMSAADEETASHSFRTAGRLLLYAAPLAVAMWVFFPRIATPFWAVPIDTGSGTSGLSDSMSPGDISSLSLSDAVAFRVRFDGDVPAPRELYWRGLVLNRFNGRSWSTGEPVFGGNGNEGLTFIGDPVRYTITLEPTRQRWVLALDLPYAWTLPRTERVQNALLARIQPLDQRVAYDAISYTDYRSKGDLRAPFRGWNLALPEGSNPQTRALARQMRATAGTDEAYVQAVLRKFNTEPFYYTLEPPPLGNDAVDRFVFGTRRGFCEHYASAFAVMMRAAGIPARVVLGYQGGEMNSIGNYLIVRQSDAHAWTEVWLGEAGWQRVDPTGAVAPERIEVGVRGAMLDGVGAAWGMSAPSELLHRLRLTFDALNARWNEWILGYGPDNQNRLMEWLGMDEPGWQKMFLALIGIGAGLIAIISMLLMLRYRPPEQDRASILYARFVKKLGVAPMVGETPSRFAARAAASTTIPAGAIDETISFYIEARYGPDGPDALRSLEESIAALP